MRRRRTRPAGRTSWWACVVGSCRGGRRASSAAIRRIRRPCSGPASVDSAPAPTSAAAVEERMCPPSTATVVIATTSGSCVAVNSASAWRSSRSGSTPRYSSIAGVPRTTRNSTKKIASLPTPDQLENSASTSRRMPLTTKKNGTKTPKATAVSFESSSGTSRAETTWRVIRPAANPPSSRSSPRSDGDQREREHEHDEPAHGELRARLDRPLEHRHRARGRADGEHGDPDGERDERDQDQRVVQRALGREHERQQQDRPELPDRPGGEQVAPELGLQLSRVGQDRDQRADRGRRERGARRRPARRRRRARRGSRPACRRSRARAPSRRGASRNGSPAMRPRSIS